MAAQIQPWQDEYWDTLSYAACRSTLLEISKVLKDVRNDPLRQIVSEMQRRLSDYIQIRFNPRLVIYDVLQEKREDVTEIP